MAQPSTPVILERFARHKAPAQGRVLFDMFEADRVLKHAYPDQAARYGRSALRSARTVYHLSHVENFHPYIAFASKRLRLAEALGTIIGPISVVWNEQQMTGYDVDFTPLRSDYMPHRIEQVLRSLIITARKLHDEHYDAVIAGTLASVSSAVPAEVAEPNDNAIVATALPGTNAEVFETVMRKLPDEPAPLRVIDANAIDISRGGAPVRLFVA